MLVCIPLSTLEASKASGRYTIVTTLYDLIEATQEAIAPEDDALVTPIVMHLLRWGRMSFLGDRRECAAATPLSGSTGW